MKSFLSLDGLRTVTFLSETDAKNKLKKYQKEGKVITRYKFPTQTATLDRYISTLTDPNTLPLSQQEPDAFVVFISKSELNIDQGMKVPGYYKIRLREQDGIYWQTTELLYTGNAYSK